MNLCSSLYPHERFRVRPPARWQDDEQARSRQPIVLARRVRWPLRVIIGLLLGALLGPHAPGQGPMPEEGATLFPHGAFLSYNFAITSNQREPFAPPGTLSSLQPTRVLEMPLVFSWSPRRDLQLRASVPYIDKSVELAGQTFGSSGLGDAMLALKYRFLRRDSARGTTQASLEFASKLPTGSTDNVDSSGNRLSHYLQPGSGSLDWRIKLMATYTGLLGLRRLVADFALAHLLRSEDGQGINMGDLTEGRLWIHFRPLQTKLVGGEWFIGPDFHWKRSEPMSLRGVESPETGSDIFTAGITTYISPRGGITFWASANFPVRQDWNGAPYEQRSRLSFGVTKQFVLGR